MEALVETWRINARINRYVLANIPSECLAVKLAKGKSVGANFSHIHNVRLMWLKAAGPDLFDGLTKFESGSEPTKGELDAALVSSDSAIEELVRRAETPAGRIKGFKPHATAFVGYLIAHESFHRAMAEIALRQSGNPLDDKTAYGTWEWGTR